MPEARVSVALATYQGERFIREQLHSIINQTRPVAEIVVCDDGSTDATVDIVKEVAASVQGNLRVKVAATDRVGGVTPNFERALAACSGDVIALSDQDDVWHPDRIETALAALGRTDEAALAFSDARLVDSRGDALGATLHASLHLRRSESRAFAQGDAFKVLIRRNVVTGAATLVTRALVERASPFPEGWVHDEWLAIIAAASGRTVLIPDQLIDYRLHASNQIGVEDPSMAGGVRRMLSARADRLTRLRDRTRVLEERLNELEVDPEIEALARRKAQFESVRATYPRTRIARVPAVLVQWVNGRYGPLASQGVLDVVRDLLQRA